MRARSSPAAFRTLDTVLPAHVVAPGSDPWAFTLEARAPPATYAFEGEERAASDYLTATETMGLLVAAQGNDVR